MISLLTSEEGFGLNEMDEEEGGMQVKSADSLVDLIDSPEKSRRSSLYKYMYTRGPPVQVGGGRCQFVCWFSLCENGRSQTQRGGYYNLILFFH